MKKVGLYTLFLTLGLVLSQIVALGDHKFWLYAADTTCLAYIMIEVGLAFHVDKSRPTAYAKDLLIAMTAAAFPWLFCFTYIFLLSSLTVNQSLLLARFAAPTSTGVLMTLLTAAGLGATWVFRKARILAIFDDLDTILLLVPLEMLVGGFTPESLWSLALIMVLLWVAYRHLHRWSLPSHPVQIFGYGLIISIICFALEFYLHMRVEVLLPAFCFGCTLSAVFHLDPEKIHREMTPGGRRFDYAVKSLFMFFVGLSIPRLDIATLNVNRLLLDVAILSLLMNIGKCFPLFCYRKEATLRDRLALSISIFPRGEVGAGVLFLALKYGISGEMATAAGLTLGLNILLTGLFITIVKRLLQNELKHS